LTEKLPTRNFSTVSGKDTAAIAAKNARFMPFMHKPTNRLDQELEKERQI
jgi:hypothetical protein